MSRIGNKPIPVPAGVKVVIEGRNVSVDGPKGKLSWSHRPEIGLDYDQDAKVITVQRKNNDRLSRALHGTTRALIANMLEGCLTGYERGLEIYGVGYGIQIQDQKLSLSVGYANQCVFDIPDGLTITVQAPQARGDTDPAKFTVSGVDKQAVGQFAARLRKARPPEPYKGKGMRYAGEYIRRKAGKAFAGTGE